jgi:hypothetical protein
VKQKIVLIGSVLAIIVVLAGFGRFVFGVDYTATTALSNSNDNAQSIVEIRDDVETLKDTVVFHDLNYKAEFKAVQKTVGQNNSILKQMATKQGIIIP